MDNFTYEKIEPERGGIFILRKNNDGTAWIPVDESNSDYQAYLASLEEIA